MHHREGWLDPVFVWLSRAGTLGLVWVALALLLAVLWRRPTIFLLVASGDLLAQLATAGLKRLIDVDRPPSRYAEPEPLVSVPTGHSFPSGHAASSFACATLLALAAPRLAVPVLVLAAAIAFSRVYVGVHWPLDVLAGALIGVVLAIALGRLVVIRRRSRPVRPAD